MAMSMADQHPIPRPLDNSRDHYTTWTGVDDKVDLADSQISGSGWYGTVETTAFIAANLTLPQCTRIFSSYADDDEAPAFAHMSLSPWTQSYLSLLYGEGGLALHHSEYNESMKRQRDAWLLRREGEREYHRMQFGRHQRQANVHEEDMVQRRNDAFWAQPGIAQQVLHPALRAPPALPIQSARPLPLQGSHPLQQGSHPLRQEYRPPQVPVLRASQTHTGHPNAAHSQAQSLGASLSHAGHETQTYQPASSASANASASATVDVRAPRPGPVPGILRPLAVATMYQHRTTQARTETSLPPGRTSDQNNGFGTIHPARLPSTSAYSSGPTSQSSRYVSLTDLFKRRRLTESSSVETAIADWLSPFPMTMPLPSAAGTAPSLNPTRDVDVHQSDALFSSRHTTTRPRDSTAAGEVSWRRIRPGQRSELESGESTSTTSGQYDDDETEDEYQDEEATHMWTNATDYYSKNLTGREPTTSTRNHIGRDQLTPTLVGDETETDPDMDSDMDMDMDSDKDVTPGPDIPRPQKRPRPSSESDADTDAQAAAVGQSVSQTLSDMIGSETSSSETSDGADPDFKLPSRRPRRRPGGMLSRPKQPRGRRHSQRIGK
ncbi:hypothetical protein A1O3_03766 [Capronia epimyces CBS 606.96]|uniref:Uncharacterized protein n=1 Tax=Capronia epimyces CBS 606.96 TaxID=1182542 RepID=W9Y1X6_9EURO|nr:uncharacterized protein A1O3_03766 [Capronia epimyces CBS 606.96]EXJ86812.1 hypothetical protein A1O3_03766 [Capronia epimyces CBS 606.96]